MVYQLILILIFVVIYSISYCVRGIAGKSSGRICGEIQMIPIMQIKTICIKVLVLFIVVQCKAI